MIKKIEIENFKCFEKAEIEFKNLNLLSGANASGKSSIIQAFLFCVYNYSNLNNIALKDYIDELGGFREIRNIITNAKRVGINIIDNENSNIYLDFFEYSDNFVQIAFAGKKKDLKKFQNKFNFASEKVKYLSANRIGQKETYKKSLDKNNKFGIYGEYVFSYFQDNKQSAIIPELIIDKNSNTLETQVNFWLNKILSSKLSTEEITKSNQVKALFSNNKLPQEIQIRPTNTGTGLSYLASIIIVCLASKKDDIIIIENPEIHLHPKAQSLLTEFFAFVANAGIQLIIETHSDHIINGTLIACKKFEENNGGISKDDVSIYFCEQNEETMLSEAIHIPILSNGRIKNVPEGFFDQFDIDMKTLMGF